MAIPFVGVLVLLLSISSLIANYAEGTEAPQCRDEACSNGKELWTAVENDELSTLKKPGATLEWKRCGVDLEESRRLDALDQSSIQGEFGCNEAPG